MWFKNLIAYRLKAQCHFDHEQLVHQLQKDRFTPCGRQEETRLGWVSPLGEQSELLVHTVAEHHLLCACKEEKLLPATVIKQTLQKQLIERQAAGRGLPHKAELHALKEKIWYELLPRAFSTLHYTQLWIDSRSGILALNTASLAKAEEILGLLRNNLGSLPITPWIDNTALCSCLTRWVRTCTPPDPFTLQSEIELRSQQELNTIIRCKNQPLESDEITAHLAARKVVTQLALAWPDHIQFVITDTGLLKRLKFSHTVRQQNDAIDDEDIRQRFDADFVLATSELTTLFKVLYEALQT